MEEKDQSGTASQGVPLLDLRAQYAKIEDKILEAIRAVCEEQRFILGERVKKLEAAVAEYAHCSYGVGVSSGTDALLVALMALGVGRGDEVITSPYTFFATGGSIARVGARPVFCDVDAGTFNMSADFLKDLIQHQYERSDGYLVNRETGGVLKAVMPIHLFGQTAEMNSIVDLARHHDLRVIEDAAQALGSEDGDGRRAGGMGDVGCFSFFPSKNLGAFGDGGMCTTNDQALAERIRILRSHGAKPKYHHSMIGGNFRLDELQAAVLLVKFEHLESWTRERQRNAQFYDQELADASLSKHVVPPFVRSGGRDIFNQYVIRAERRDALRQALSRANIGTEVYYPVPLHMQACFKYLGYRPEEFPESKRASEETLAIPVYPELTLSQQRYVVSSIKKFYME
jgi:dTDP-4-amino-4,6-dideoxygalactose transaminase